MLKNTLKPSILSVSFVGFGNDYKLAKMHNSSIIKISVIFH